jgi:hypothetical protein
MTVIGCTGHQYIPAAALDHVTKGIRTEIATHEGDLVGVCSLAIGADQLFARLVLARGGRLHAVLPCEKYEKTFVDDVAQAEYQLLLDRASLVDVLDHEDPSEEAFLDAGYRVADLSDLLIAVWDGKDAQGKGGTGDVVTYAEQHSVRLVVIWPEGVDRQRKA